jgi:hypothetical protein
MTEDTTEARRENFANVANEATDAEIDRLTSAVHMGLVVIGMIDSIGEGKAMMDKMGVDAGDGQVGSSTIIGHKETGELFAITVTTATEEDAAAHQAMLASAHDIDEPLTRH